MLRQQGLYCIMKQVLLIAGLFWGIAAYGQLPNIDKPNTLVQPEVLPTYKGGEAAQLKFIKDNIKLPPGTMYDGITYISYTVDTLGSVVNARVLRGFNKTADAEALRVVSLLKYERPGMVNSRPVNMEMVMPVRIKTF